MPYGYEEVQTFIRLGKETLEEFIKAFDPEEPQKESSKPFTITDLEWRERQYYPYAYEFVELTKEIVEDGLVLGFDHVAALFATEDPPEEIVLRWVGQEVTIRQKQ